MCKICVGFLHSYRKTPLIGLKLLDCTIEIMNFAKEFFGVLKIELFKSEFWSFLSVDFLNVDIYEKGLWKEKIFKKFSY